MSGFVRECNRAASLLLLILTASCARGGGHIVRRLALDRGAPIKVFASAGQVRLIAWDRDTLAIDAAVPSDTEFLFLGDSRGAKFGVFEKSSDRAAKPAFFTVYLPRASRVSVKTASANVDGTDVSGFFYTVSGQISLRGSVREIDAQSLSGPILLTVKSPWVRARTANGAMSLGGVVSDVGLATVTGSIDVTASGVERMQAQTIGGRVTVAGSAASPTSIDVDTHSGAIDVTLPTTSMSRLVLRAQSTRGTIDTTTVGAFPAPRPQRVTPFMLVAGRETDAVSSVNLTTFDGPVRIHVPPELKIRER